MSIYEGTRVEQEYAHGRDEGRIWAEQDRQYGGNGSYWLNEFTKDAQSTSRDLRAFYLGVLRGYREVTR